MLIMGALRVTLSALPTPVGSTALERLLLLIVNSFSAVMLMSPAFPIPAVEEERLEPSVIARLGALTAILPAFPFPVGSTALEIVTPLSCKFSVALISTIPASPIPARKETS